MIGMLVNFTLVCLSVAFHAKRNRKVLAEGIRFMKNRAAQIRLGGSQALALGVKLVEQVIKDLNFGCATPGITAQHEVYLIAVATVSLKLLGPMKWSVLPPVRVDHGQALLSRYVPNGEWYGESS